MNADSTEGLGLGLLLSLINFAVSTLGVCKLACETCAAFTATQNMRNDVNMMVRGRAWPPTASHAAPQLLLHAFRIRHSEEAISKHLGPEIHSSLHAC